MNERAGRKYRRSGVIPIRTVDDIPQILLITSRDGRRWSIPKGMLEPFLSPEESAAKEAWEEAGVRGHVDPSPVGEYCYDKAGRLQRVLVFRLEVDEVLDSWPEAHFRQRQWLSPSEAVRRVDFPSLKRLLETVAAPRETREPGAPSADGDVT